MATRRQFLKVATASGVALYFTQRFDVPPRVVAQVAGGTLAPGAVAKFVTPLVIPPAMPLFGADATTDYFSIAVRQFESQILPKPHRPTTVWGYGSTTDPNSFGAPSATIEARASRRTQVQWSNQLVDSRGRFLPHLLPVDQTLHWANPPGGLSQRDMNGTDPRAYRGPVPLVTHVHGAHASDDSDGYPEAWYLPAAVDIPQGYAITGTWYDFFRAKFVAQWGGAWDPGSATFMYENDQRATTLWYHDHALGMTRANVYAGPAGFYLIRGGSSDLAPGILPGPAPAPGDTPGTRYYEIPIAIQDRSFNADSSLFYPDNRAFFEGLEKGLLKIPFIPDAGCAGPSDVPPIWNPEFFGNMLVVNGRTWPYLEVEQRRYRFRFLNGCDSRFLVLKLSRQGIPFWQIGAEGGVLPAPVCLDQLLMGPAERADVIVDFTSVPVGTEIVLQNLGPDEPFGGGEPDEDFDVSDPNGTGLVMQFRVVPARSADTSTPPGSLTLPARAALPAATVTRRLSLNEAESETVFVDAHPSHGHRRHELEKLALACNDPNAFPFGPTMALLGTLDSNGEGNALRWSDAITENPDPGATEIWELHNFTQDAHPIHIHQVQFEVVERQDAAGNVRAPEPWETGTKDTVISYPGEVTRVKATFERAGQYVWHCHILEHEDNEMMRPYSVGPVQTPLKPGQTG
jgi:FtsP/CotA-like multicopper oxidase with cupredoxin domain